MADPRRSPGPVADRAFAAGIKAAAVAGLAAIALLYWTGHLPVERALFTLCFLFPVYLVFVALVLGQWLGYDPDEGNLRPVSADEAEPDWHRRL